MSKDKSVRFPNFLVMIGAMLLVLGALSWLVGAMNRRDSGVDTTRLQAISGGGEINATTAFEQAVNRYIEETPPIRSTGESDALRLNLYLRDNRPVFGYLDDACKAGRISFRRNWNAGFKVERLGVVDVHNLAKLNYYRMLAETDAAKSVRLAHNIGVLANFLIYDPMPSSAQVYAPAMHIYLAALELQLARPGRCSREELDGILAGLKSCNRNAYTLFADALLTERDLLEMLPQTLDVYGSYTDTAKRAADISEAHDLLSRLAVLLRSDYASNSEELDAWSVPAANPIALSVVPDRGYAELLAGLVTRLRLAQAAIQTKLLYEADGEMPTIGELAGVKCVDALTGEPFVLEASRKDMLTVHSANDAFTVGLSAVKRQP